MTSPDPLAAAVTAAEAAQTYGTAQISALQQQNASLTAQHQQDQATIAAQSAQITQLEAELNPTPQPPPPPAVTTAYGINASTASEKAAVDALLGAGNIKLLRYYHQPGEPLTYPTEYQLAPGQGFVFSGKVLPQSIAVPMLVALFKSVPSGVPFYYCPWHEPEDNIAAGQFTTAQLKAAYAVARQAHQQVGSPSNIKLTPILMGYTWAKASGRTVTDYLPDDANWDVLGVDPYFGGTIGQPVSAIPTAFDPVIATAQAHGKAWLVSETGVGQNVTGAARNSALTLLAQTTKAKGAVGCTYFVGGGSTQWQLFTSDGSAAAWLAGQAG